MKKNYVTCGRNWLWKRGASTASLIVWKEKFSKKEKKWMKNDLIENHCSNHGLGNGRNYSEIAKSIFKRSMSTLVINHHTVIRPSHQRPYEPKFYNDKIQNMNFSKVFLLPWKCALPYLSAVFIVNYLKNFRNIIAMRMYKISTLPLDSLRTLAVSWVK